MCAGFLVEGMADGNHSSWGKKSVSQSVNDLIAPCHFPDGSGSNR